MTALRPPAKVFFVLLGLVGAFVIAWLAVLLRQRLTLGPEAQASSGMHALGDLLLGLGVFGILALVPIGLGLFWLRSVPRFWSALLWGTMLVVLTGIVAMTENVWASPSTIELILLAHARVGIMPLTAMMFLAFALFAPQVRHRRLFAGAALAESALFVSLIFIHFALPALRNG